MTIFDSSINIGNDKEEYMLDFRIETFLKVCDHMNFTTAADCVSSYQILRG